MECPHCGGKLEGSGELYTCESCGRRYEIAFFCEICGTRVSPALACGGASFFCEPCRDIKSRETMKKEFYLKR